MLKVHSPFVSHKSDIGGVKVNLKTENAVEEAFAEILAAAMPLDPAAKVTVQQMVFPLAEVIVGMHNDPQFGPVLALGMGGVFVEILKDLSWRLIPVDRRDVQQMMQEVKGTVLLSGYRGKPKGDVIAIEDLLLRISALAQAHEDVVSLDLNPVFVFDEGQGVAIGDARLVRGSSGRQLPTCRYLSEERGKRLFDPASVAVVGASPDKQRLSYNVIENLLRNGYRGRIYPVHPTYKAILGLKVYPSLKSLPTPPDVVINAVSAGITLKVAQECVDISAGGMVVYTSGFKELGEAGESLQKELRKISNDYDLPIIGPNSPGLVNAHSRLNLSFAPFNLKKGSISLITQSGGMGGILYRQMMEEGLGIAKWIGVGNRLSLGFEAILDFLATDPVTKVIGVYMEGADDAREFVQKAREVVFKKPVLVYKAGVSSEANQASMTHTGSMAGSYELYEAAFRQYGILLARDSFGFTSGCKALAISPVPQGTHLGVLTVTGGANIVVLDHLMKRGAGILAKLSPTTEKAIKSLTGEKAPILVQNPLDLTTQGFEPQTFISVMEVLINAPEVDVLLAMIAIHPNFPFPFEEIPRLQKSSNKPLIIMLGYDIINKEHRKRIEVLQAKGIPVYASAEQAAWGANYLLQYAQIRADLEATSN